MSIHNPPDPTGVTLHTILDLLTAGRVDAARNGLTAWLDALPPAVGAAAPSQLRAGLTHGWVTCETADCGVFLPEWWDDAEVNDDGARFCGDCGPHERRLFPGEWRESLAWDDAERSLDAARDLAYETGTR